MAVDKLVRTQRAPTKRNLLKTKGLFFLAVLVFAEPPPLAVLAHHFDAVPAVLRREAPLRIETRSHAADAAAGGFRGARREKRLEPGRVGRPLKRRDELLVYLPRLGGCRGEWRRVGQGRRCRRSFQALLLLVLEVHVLDHKEEVVAAVGARLRGRIGAAAAAPVLARVAVARVRAGRVEALPPPGVKARLPARRRRRAKP
mmetsp:Transcript_13168/g.31143  ORF Transcript_13168/g.31143 Transcript_13168/m.31143 type:complete len:201 (+) Transcript_13168:314-916(+)